MAYNRAVTQLVHFKPGYTHPMISTYEDVSLVLGTPVTEGDEKGDFIAVVTCDSMLPFPADFSSLGTLLERQGGVQVFMQHLESEFSKENLIFWLKATECISKNCATTNWQECVNLYDNFIKIESPCEINIPAKTRNLVTEAMEAADPDRVEAAFREAREDIFKLMSRDSFPRFQVTSAYQNLYAESLRYYMSPADQRGSVSNGMIFSDISLQPEVVEVQNSTLALLVFDGWKDMYELILDDGKSAQHISKTFDVFLSMILDVITSYGGDCLQVTNEYVLVLFSKPSAKSDIQYHPFASQQISVRTEHDSSLRTSLALRAAECVMSLKKKITAEHRPGANFKIASFLATGTVEVMHVGTEGTWHILANGKAMRRIHQIQQEAKNAKCKADDVVVHTRLWSFINKHKFDGKPLTNATVVVTDMPPKLSVQKVFRRPSPFVTEELLEALRAYIPAQVLANLDSGKALNGFSEMTTVSVVCIHMPSLCSHPTKSFISALSTLAVVCHHNCGYQLSPELSSSGAFVRFVFGLSSEKEHVDQALKTAFSSNDTLTDLNIPHFISVATGLVCSSIMGSDIRKQHHVVGVPMLIGQHLCEWAPTFYKDKSVTERSLPLVCDEATHDQSKYAMEPTNNIIKFGTHVLKCFLPSKHMDPTEVLLSKHGNTLGREDEVIIYMKALAAQSRSFCIYVEGRKGVGKTHLVSQYYKIAKAKKCIQPYYILAQHSDRQVDFSIFAQILENITGGLNADGVENRKQHFKGFLEEYCNSISPSDPRLSLLNQVFYRYHHGLGFPRNKLAEVLSDDKDAFRHQLQMLLSEILVSFVEATFKKKKQQCVFFIEDVHFLDPYSFKVLAKLVHSRKLCVVFTSRPPQDIYQQSFQRDWDVIRIELSTSRSATMLRLTELEHDHRKDIATRYLEKEMSRSNDGRPARYRNDTCIFSESLLCALDERFPNLGNMMEALELLNRKQLLQIQPNNEITVAGDLGEVMAIVSNSLVFELPPEVQEHSAICALASCFEDWGWSREMLCGVAKVDDCTELMKLLIEHKIVARDGDIFKFASYEVCQYFYNKMTAEELYQAHRSIAQFLENDPSKKELWKRHLSLAVKNWEMSKRKRGDSQSDKFILKARAAFEDSELHMSYLRQTKLTEMLSTLFYKQQTFVNTLETHLVFLRSSMVAKLASGKPLYSISVSRVPKFFMNHYREDCTVLSNLHIASSGLLDHFRRANISISPVQKLCALFKGLTSREFELSLHAYCVIGAAQRELEVQLESCKEVQTLYSKVLPSVARRLERKALVPSPGDRRFTAADLQALHRDAFNPLQVFVAHIMDIRVFIQQFILDIMLPESLNKQLLDKTIIFSKDRFLGWLKQNSSESEDHNSSESEDHKFLLEMIESCENFFKVCAEVEEKLSDIRGVTLKTAEAEKAFEFADKLIDTDEQATALKFLDKAVQDDPMKPKYHASRGYILWQQGNLDESCNAFVRAFLLERAEQRNTTGTDQEIPKNWRSHVKEMLAKKALQYKEEIQKQKKKFAADKQKFRQEEARMIKELDQLQAEKTESFVKALELEKMLQKDTAEYEAMKSKMETMKAKLKSIEDSNEPDEMKLSQLEETLRQSNDSAAARKKQLTKKLMMLNETKLALQEKDHHIRMSVNELSRVSSQRFITEQSSNSLQVVPEDEYRNSLDSSLSEVEENMQSNLLNEPFRAECERLELELVALQRESQFKQDELAASYEAMKTKCARLERELAEQETRHSFKLKLVESNEKRARSQVEKLRNQQRKSEIDLRMSMAEPSLDIEDLRRVLECSPIFKNPMCFDDKQVLRVASCFGSIENAITSCVRFANQSRGRTYLNRNAYRNIHDLLTDLRASHRKDTRNIEMITELLADFHGGVILPEASALLGDYVEFGDAPWVEIAMLLQEECPIANLEELKQAVRKMHEDKPRFDAQIDPRPPPPPTAQEISKMKDVLEKHSCYQVLMRRYNYSDFSKLLLSAAENASSTELYNDSTKRFREGQIVLNGIAYSRNVTFSDWDELFAAVEHFKVSMKRNRSMLLNYFKRTSLLSSHYKWHDTDADHFIERGRSGALTLCTLQEWEQTNRFSIHKFTEPLDLLRMLEEDERKIVDHVLCYIEEEKHNLLVEGGDDSVKGDTMQCLYHFVREKRAVKVMQILGQLVESKEKCLSFLELFSRART